MVLAILCIFCMTLPLSIASAASWRFIAVTPFAAYYFDTDSIQTIKVDGDRCIQVWLRGDLQRVQADGTKVFVQQVLYKKDQSLCMYKTLYRFDQYGNNLKPLPSQETWENIIPGTLGEEIYKQVKAYCKTIYKVKSGRARSLLSPAAF